MYFKSSAPIMRQLLGKVTKNVQPPILGRWGTHARLLWHDTLPRKIRKAIPTTLIKWTPSCDQAPGLHGVVFKLRVTQLRVARRSTSHPAKNCWTPVTGQSEGQSLGQKLIGFLHKKETGYGRMTSAAVSHMCQRRTDK